MRNNVTFKTRLFSEVIQPNVTDANSAREYITKGFYGDSKTRSITNSVGLGLLGAGIGAGAGAFAGRKDKSRLNKYKGIGALAGGLIGGIAGYKNPNLITNDEKSRARAIDIIKELGWSYAVIVDPKTGKIKSEAFENPQEAANKVKEAKTMGNKGYVVPLSSFNNFE